MYVYDVPNDEDSKDIIFGFVTGGYTMLGHELRLSGVQGHELRLSKGLVSGRPLKSLKATSMIRMCVCLRLCCNCCCRSSAVGLTPPFFTKRSKHRSTPAPHTYPPSPRLSCLCMYLFSAR
eukprot:354028-Chlamydomonas_euryale.AAC.12